MIEFDRSAGDLVSHCDNGIQAHFREHLNCLLEKSPSDASLVFQVSKVREAYQGVIEIISSQRKFLASAICADPNELTCDLIEQIHLQIMNWGKERALILQECC